jgi:hypothetical protein
MAPLKREPTWVGIIRPPLLALGFVFGAIYTGLFGWWLDALLWRRGDKRLANEIKQNLAFLFCELEGRIVPSDDYGVPRAFDLAVVTVSTQDFLIRFVRVRGEFNVQVASTKPPHRWEDLSAALENAELREGATLNGVVATRSSRAYSSFADVKRLLRTRWADLQNYWIQW